MSCVTNLFKLYLLITPGARRTRAHSHPQTDLCCRTQRRRIGVGERGRSRPPRSGRRREPHGAGPRPRHLLDGDQVLSHHRPGALHHEDPDSAPWAQALPPRLTHSRHLLQRRVRRGRSACLVASTSVVNRDPRTASDRTSTGPGLGRRAGTGATRLTRTVKEPDAPGARDLDRAQRDHKRTQASKKRSTSSPPSARAPSTASTRGTGPRPEGIAST